MSRGVSQRRRVLRAPFGVSGYRRSLFLMLAVACVTAAAAAQSITVTPGVTTLTIHPGDTDVALPFRVSGTDYSGPVTVTVTGLPSSITVTPTTVSAGGSGTVLLSAGVSADQENFLADYGPGVPNTATSNILLSAFSGSLQASSAIALTVSLANPAYVPGADQINLPIVTIDTSGVGIIDKTTDVPGTMTITSADGKTTYLSASAGAATFHLHGNSTLQMPKKAYHVKLNSSTDLLTAMGLQCPYVTGSGKAVCDKSKSYILLANYDDKSLLREWSASALSNAIPNGGDFLSASPGSPSPTGTSAYSTWAPHSLFVELYLNGEYMGNYQLIEEIKVDSHRVNITEMDETDTSGNALTGGYLVEIDEHQDEDFVFTTPKGVPLGLIDPDYTPEVIQQTNYIQSYVAQTEQALFSADYTDPALGWRAYFDEAAAVNFYIVNDVMGNVDGGNFYSSDYFYKERNNPLIYMGPVWDFDISSGNVNYKAIVTPTVPWMQGEAKWYARWFTDPGFRAAVVQQWNALKNDGILSTWLQSIQQQAAALEQSQQNNSGRWPMQGEKVWPNAEAAGSYDGEVAYLTGWIDLRIGYLDSQFNPKMATTTLLTPPASGLRSGSPAALTASVSGGQSPTGVISFLCDGVFLGSAPMDSTGTATLTTSNLPAGNETILAVYNGDHTNALSYSSNAQATVLPPLVQSVVNLTTSTNAVQSPAPVTLTAAVTVSSGTTAPTGTITFLSGGTAVGTAPLSAGLATLTVSDLPVGEDALTASYSGDTVAGPSTSNSVSVEETLPPATAPVLSPAGGSFTSDQTVTISDPMEGSTIYYTTDGSTPSTGSTQYTGPLTVDVTETVQAFAIADGYASSSVASATYTIQPTFAVSIPTAPLTATRRSPANTTITLTPAHGFEGSVSLSCTGLPAGWGCTFSPSSVIVSGATTVNLAIGATQTGRSERREAAPWRWTGVPVFALLLIVPLRRRRMARLLVLLVAVAASVGFEGCGGGVPVQNSTVTVQATGGGVTQTTTIAVTLKG